MNNTFQLLFTLISGKGINRIGNLLVPNDNYVKFEDWILPILDAMLLEQKETGIIWTPSKVIARLGMDSFITGQGTPLIFI